MKLRDLVIEAAKQKTFARKAESYINKTFYVFNDKMSSDDKIVYIIEERKAKYEIHVSGNSVVVTPDLGSGANRARAKEIKQLVAAAGNK